MSVVSKAQNAAMHAAREGKSTLGIPASVGAEFTADQAPGSVKKLPERVAPKKKKASKRSTNLLKRGVVSNAARDKFNTKDQQPIDAATR